MALPRLSRAALALLAACGGQQQNVTLYGAPPMEPAPDAAASSTPAPEPPPTVTAQPMYGAAPVPQK